MLPSEFEQVASYEGLRRFLESHVDMYFEDARSMLRLPLEGNGLWGGCNHSLVMLICNIIAGVSTWLWHPPFEEIRSTRDLKELGRALKMLQQGGAQRFKGLMLECYPWPEELPDKQQCTAVLYDELRHSLTHRLGVGFQMHNGRPTYTFVGKGALTPDGIRALEEPDPQADPVVGFHRIDNKVGRGAVYIDGERPDIVCWLVDACGLYSGIHELLRTLFGDEQRARDADRMARLLMGGKFPHIQPLSGRGG